ncbi:hypothetical protein B0O80DRAFT_101831 [Mortierella sp. GBAus27b]|nr:hypothetical protein B0O80DRAFT_101831 [Mortierella sp. GBAus27b]
MMSDTLLPSQALLRLVCLFDAPLQSGRLCVQMPNNDVRDSCWKRRMSTCMIQRLTCDPKAELEASPCKCRWTCPL